MDIKLADTKSIKDIAAVLFYPMTGISAMFLFNPSLHWFIDSANATLTDYQLFIRFILTFAYVFAVSTFWVWGLGVAICFILIDFGWFKLVRFTGWFLVGLGVLGLFAIHIFPPLSYLPQIIYVTILVWGVRYIDIFDKKNIR